MFGVEVNMAAQLQSLNPLLLFSFVLCLSSTFLFRKDFLRICSLNLFEPLSALFPGSLLSSGKLLLGACEDLLLKAVRLLAEPILRWPAVVGVVLLVGCAPEPTAHLCFV